MSAEPCATAPEPSMLGPMPYYVTNPVVVAGGRPFIAEIQDAVAAYYGLTRDDLKKDRRSQHISEARQLAMLFAREMTGRSYPEIGRAFGGRHHSTVLHAIDAAQMRIKRLQTEEVVYRSIRFNIERIIAARMTDIARMGLGVA